MKDILRKFFLSLLLLPTAPLAHLWFGQEYKGPGMNQIDVLLVTVAFGAGTTVLFALLTGILGFMVRRKTRTVKIGCDMVVFLVLLIVNIAAGLTAKVV